MEHWKVEMPLPPFKPALDIYNVKKGKTVTSQYSANQENKYLDQS